MAETFRVRPCPVSLIDHDPMVSGGIGLDAEQTPHATCLFCGHAVQPADADVTDASGIRFHDNLPVVYRRLHLPLPPAPATWPGTGALSTIC